MRHATKRHTDILRAVRTHGTYPIADLARALNVSDETIRRDVRRLVDEGMVIKVHGAIVAPEHLREDPFQLRLQENRTEKSRIAAAAAGMIRHGASVMMDTGSTTAYLAQHLTDHRNLFTVTNSLEVARTLANQNGNRVYMAGGEVRADDGAVFGETATEFAARFQVELGILSIAAISEKDGFLDNELWEADYSRMVIRQAERVIVVADHSKFGRRALVKVCDFAQVDTLVTSARPSPSLKACLEEAGVDVVIA